MTLILASGSSIRLAMLGAAGVAVTVDPADIDETAVKAVHGGDDPALALALAEAKAIETSRRSLQNWVIGGDSLVSVDGRRFDKPTGRDDAVAHLRFFSGKKMRLTSAAALAKDGRVDWSQAAQATLHIRLLSDDFIHTYLEAEWPAVSYCVGVFRLEGRGVTLFSRVEGDYFTILGMPLLPLLGALRDRGLVAA
ncbi:Maf family protein [Sphingomonas sp.]|uniref:Maf family protein n=1 Tax=Sphingomonas sp. TaxID=28214 RepID=UPI00286BE1A3|nr:Maf family protein [Sphingomonas sp.]